MSSVGSWASLTHLSAREGPSVRGVGLWRAGGLPAGGALPLWLRGGLEETPSRRIPAARWTADRSLGRGEQCPSGRKALVCDFPMPSPPGGGPCAPRRRELHLDKPLPSGNLSTITCSLMGKPRQDACLVVEAGFELRACIWSLQAALGTQGKCQRIEQPCEQAAYRGRGL